MEKIEQNLKLPDVSNAVLYILLHVYAALSCERNPVKS